MADRDDMVTLIVGGERHQGWTAVRISRALDTLVGSFDVTLTERWADQPARFTLEAGSPCRVEIAGTTVIDGWIDALSPSIDAESHAITISGRDRAADLIDCSAIATPGSWTNKSIEAIVAELAKPFGVAVHVGASTGAPLKRFALQQGESVQAVIDRLCRFRGLIAISRSDGSIELTNPAKGAPRERLVEGDNILTAAASHNVGQRFSTYIVKGQASGNDQASGKTVSAVKAEAKDPGVRRYRPLLIIAEEQSTIAALETRAKWEATTRLGKAQQVTVTALGWHAPDGQLRDRNTIVAVDAPSMFVVGDMLVQQVDYLFDDRGRTAELTLVPPEAWQQMAVPEKADPSRVGKKQKVAR